MKIRKTQSGIMLIEVLVGMIIFLIGIVGIMGLQALAIKQTEDSRYRSEAGYLANRIVSRMWVDNNNLAAYVTAANTACPSQPTTERDRWLCTVISTLPNSTGANSPTIAVTGTAVTVTIQWQKDAADPVHKHVITTDISPH